MLTYYQIVAGDWHYLVDYDAVVAGITAEEITPGGRHLPGCGQPHRAALGKEGGLAMKGATRFLGFAFLLPGAWPPAPRGRLPNLRP